VKNNKINNLYLVWEDKQDADSLNDLFAEARRAIVAKYKLAEPELCEDIAQKALEVVFRALPGYVGPSKIKVFNKNKVDFSLFCSMTARRERGHMIRHERLSTNFCLSDTRLSDVGSQEKGY
jgi:hypothetical protein